MRFLGLLLMLLTLLVPFRAGAHDPYPCEDWLESDYDFKVYTVVERLREFPDWPEYEECVLMNTSHYVAWIARRCISSGTPTFMSIAAGLLLEAKYRCS